MPTKRIKISELPIAASLNGLHTIGVDKQNKSVRVSMEFVEEVADAANKAASNACAAAKLAEEAAGKIIDPIDILTHSGCSLDERVKALEKMLIAVLSGSVLVPNIQVKKLGVWDENNLIVTGAGAPTQIPDRAGQFYIDVTARTLYYSTGNAAVADWKNA